VRVDQYNLLCRVTGTNVAAAAAAAADRMVVIAILRVALDFSANLQLLIWQLILWPLAAFRIFSLSTKTILRFIVTVCGGRIGLTVQSAIVDR